MADHTLDAKGLNCPLPILKARKALKEDEPDSDEGEFLEHSVDDSIYRFLIKHTAA